jgi:hypothetical protein
VLLFKGVFGEGDKKLSNNMRELTAAASAIHACIHTTEHKVQWRNKVILLESDNTTTVAYVNRGGGNQDTLAKYTAALVQWLYSMGTTVIARHLPGVLNITADALSRGMSHLSLSSLILSPAAFQCINSRWGPFDLHIFAKQFNNLTPLFADVEGRGTCPTPAWLLDWGMHTPIVTPHPNSIARAIAKVQADRATVVMVVPAWPSQPWWPLLFSLIIDTPQLLPDASLSWLTPTSSIPQPWIRWATIGVCLSGVHSCREAFLDKWSILLSTRDGVSRLRESMIVCGPGGASTSMREETIRNCLLSISSSISSSLVSRLA